MAEDDMKGLRGHPSDRISALPDELLDLILAPLPLCDVVRNGILSKRWIKCWTRHGKLEFGKDFVKRYIKGKNINKSFAKIVDSILFEQKCQVSKFDLYLPGHNPKCWNFYLKKWISFLPAHGITDLRIHGAGKYSKVNATIFKLSCLQNLELASCELCPSEGFNGFPHLITLKIDACKIPEKEWEVMMDSPSLQTLRVRCPVVCPPLKVGGRHIKSLAVDYAVCKPVFLRKCPELIDAEIRTKWVLSANNKETPGPGLNILISHLPRVKTLLFTGRTLELLASDTDTFFQTLPTSFHNLEHLELQSLDITSLEQLICTFCLIRSSPNLQSLVISEIVEREVDDDFHADMIDLFAVQSREIITSKIQTVTFIDVVGVIEEIHLINTIVKCCPGLKSVNVKRNPAFPYDWEWYFEELSSIHGSLIVEDGQTDSYNHLTSTTT